MIIAILVWWYCIKCILFIRIWNRSIFYWIITAYQKISDFGISRFKDDSTSIITQQIDTTQWMAPEQLMTATYTNKVDVYLFGISQISSFVLSTLRNFFTSSRGGLTLLLTSVGPFVDGFMLSLSLSQEIAEQRRILLPQCLVVRDVERGRALRARCVPCCSRPRLAQLYSRRGSRISWWPRG